MQQRCSTEHSPPLLQRDIDTNDMPLLRVRLRWMAVLHDLPALHADTRGQAVQEMRGKLGNKTRGQPGKKRGALRGVR
jgi:hypothetical protein